MRIIMTITNWVRIGHLLTGYDCNGGRRRCQWWLRQSQW